MQRKFAFIINPISGTGNKNLLKEKITAFAQRNGYAVDVFPSAADGDYTFLKAHIETEAVTDVVIAGGDGTINGVLDSLRDMHVQFGLLPCGSGNGLAFTTGLSRNIDAALEIIKAGKSAPTDAFLVNGHFACMLCGLGFDAAVAHAFADDPNRGLKTYIKKSVQHFFTAKAYPFTLLFQNTILEIDAFFISIANSNQFGNNFTIAPKASLTDGLLDLVIVTRQNKLNLVWQTLRQVGGFNAVQRVEVLNKNTGVIYLQTDAVTIQNPLLAPMHLDGDPTRTDETINVQLLKGCFRLIYP
jgi:diacylglycerol kinase (ATP)